ncbi:fibronectin type III domain-containing protein [Microbacterium sp. NIBRBAC000506063]|uniref:fibronectin type III domain-containing protein n=1 Tax=Microbacterium sp. NIBRBAC000506063 TaxID=2734618 RepID=UPI001BB70E6C|nr:fibronectin type III domain-containing protein [Microbacterium sp. NIBRBAC000506063]QTV80187.1 fibronectin type III domain-containing protein [Microbacterium sp. NIBRBAC000506063]
MIASTSSTSYTVPLTDSPSKYFVRARDAAGNRSASTSAISVEPGSETVVVLIENGESWSWRYTDAALPAQWAQPDFDASSWQVGDGLLARGVAAAATNIDPTGLSPRPLSAQFRKEFTVVNASTVQDGTVTVIANDGVVVYLNGTELGRQNLPTGTIGQNTYATAAPSHAAASNNRAVFTVPAGLLVEGTNVIAASVHANYRNTPDLSFDLAYTAERGDAPEAPNAVTGLTASASGHDTVELSWSAPTGGGAVTSYVVARNGTEVATLPAVETTFTDVDLTAETTYEYSITAINASGSSAAATTTVTTGALPDPSDEPVAIENGESWSWRYTDAALPAQWAQPDFDASSWQVGDGLLAREWQRQRPISTRPDCHRDR